MALRSEQNTGRIWLVFAYRARLPRSVEVLHPIQVIHLEVRPALVAVIVAAKDPESLQSLQISQTVNTGGNVSQ